MAWSGNQGNGDSEFVKKGDNMKVERYGEENDEEWAERLSEAITIADDTEATTYFVERDPMAEDSIIINYSGEGMWSYREHPEGPFTVKQILGWKNKAEKLDNLLPSLEYLAEHTDKIVEILESSELS